MAAGSAAVGRHFPKHRSIIPLHQGKTTTQTAHYSVYATVPTIM